MNRLLHTYPIKLSIVFSLEELIALSDALQIEIENGLDLYDNTLHSEQTMFFLIQCRLKIHKRMISLTTSGKAKGSLSLFHVEYRTLHRKVVRSAPAPKHTYNYFLDARAKIDQLIVNHS